MSQDSALASAFIKMVEVNANWGTKTVRINGRECSMPYTMKPLCFLLPLLNPKSKCTGCADGEWNWLRKSGCAGWIQGYVDPPPLQSVLP
jgi:hypothetical protein